MRAGLYWKRLAGLESPKKNKITLASPYLCKLFLKIASQSKEAMYNIF
jgi:hypothetical protein